MSHISRSLAVAGCAGVSLVICLPAARAEVPRTLNAQPAHPPRVCQLEEIWRVGGESTDLFFGAVTEATTDSLGNVYLLDTQRLQVVVISPEGRFVRTLSREGEGPGEVQNPRDIQILSDGTLGILELFPAKIVRLTPDGEPRGTLVVGAGGDPQSGGFTAASSFICRGGTILMGATRTTQDENGQKRLHYLAALDPAGAETVRFREQTMALDFRDLCFVERELGPPFAGVNTLGPDGRVYAAQDWDRYAIEVYRPEGSLERVIEREFENRKRTEIELRRINALFDASDRNIPVKVTRKIEPRPQVISALHVTDDGTLWVLHSRSIENRPAGVMQSYDTFDAAGRYLGVVAMACEGDPEADGLELLPDGRVLLIKEYALSAMGRTDLGSVPLGEEASGAIEIVCFRPVS